MGSSCSVPRPGCASSSYLIRAAGRTVVADFGTGAFANLVRYCAPDLVDDVVVSHLHADHFLDVVPYRYALKYGKRTTSRRVRLWIPPGSGERLARVAAVFDDESSEFFDVFEVAEYDPNAVLELGGMRVTFAPTTHFIDCYAMRFDAGGGSSVTYSADTAPDDRIAELARDTAIFLCEATLSQAEEALTPRGHLSAREAGALAARAGAKTLLLTHYPANLAPADLAREAATEFAGTIDVADDNRTLPF